MLINFDKICEKYGTPRGILHLGAHLLEERESYINKGVKNILWIEGNSNLYNNIKFVNDDNKINYEKVIIGLISDENNIEVDFNLTNNSVSSSILKLDKHKIFHPEVFVTETISIKTIRMDKLIEDNNININNFNFLNIDIQGYELKALKSFDKYLNNIDYIYTEINTDSVYVDCPMVDEIDEYLNKFNFERIETEMTPWCWGDALYIKK